MKELKISDLILDKVKTIEDGLTELKATQEKTGETVQKLEFTINGIDGKGGLREDVEQLLKERDFWRMALIVFGAIGSLATVITLILKGMIEIP
ncbi:MAG: hypothetical protein AAFR66_17045 [Bacteroidota bacterium]